MVSWTQKGPSARLAWSREPGWQAAEAGGLRCSVLGMVSRPAAGRTSRRCAPAADSGQAGLSLTWSIFKETPPDGHANRKMHTYCLSAMLGLQPSTFLLPLHLPGNGFTDQQWAPQPLPGVGGTTWGHTPSSWASLPSEFRGLAGLAPPTHGVLVTQQPTQRGRQRSLIEAQNFWLCILFVKTPCECLLPSGREWWGFPTLLRAKCF